MHACTCMMYYIHVPVHVQCTCVGMGLGIEFSHHQRQSQSSGAVLGSTDASGNSSSRESMSGPEEDGDRTALYQAIYSFSGTGEDEVCCTCMYIVHVLYMCTCMLDVCVCEFACILWGFKLSVLSETQKLWYIHVHVYYAHVHVYYAHVHVYYAHVHVYTCIHVHLIDVVHVSLL